MSDDLADLARLVMRLDNEHWPVIHRVSGGYLIKVSIQAPEFCPRTMRLRALANNLYLPFDAELVPKLLEDEASALVSERGLIFLPDGRILGFQFDDIIVPENILEAKRLPASHWRALPEGPALASRLYGIQLDLPEPTIETILDQGGQDIGSQSPRPNGGNLPGRGLGNVAFGVGKGILWLGSVLGLKALATLGANMIAGALSMAPRLSESVLGKQEAALRELLRQFREGNLEQALRRALPLGLEPGRGSVPAQDAHLPFHNLGYQVGQLLGGGGRASIWYGGGDVQQELSREYRKAAEAATRAGDFRRAAVIYGKLLGDYRSAADILSAGGLHHDAALIYLKKLNDKHAAARAFAASGETDRAADLYRQCGDHVAAGDLLKSVGELEMALAEYCLASEQLVSHSNAFLQAGELMLAKAERSDLALKYFRAGWSRRPNASAIACAMQMARVLTSVEHKQQLLALMTEAETYFHPPGNELAATQFFNLLAQLAEGKSLEDVREELRDRALLGIANKLRQRASVSTLPENTVSTFLGQAKAWPPAVVSDADFAYRSLVKPASKSVSQTPLSKSPTVTWTHAGQGVVTAVCVAPSAGHVYLGFESGDIVCFRPSKNDRLFVLSRSESRNKVLSLSADSWGKLLVALNEKSLSKVELRSYLLNESAGNVESYALSQARTIEEAVDCRLAPLIVPLKRTGWMVGLWNRGGLCVMSGPLLNRVETRGPTGIENNAGVFLLPPYEALRDDLAILWFEADGIGSQLNRKKTPTMARLGWCPDIRQGSSLASAPYSWLLTGPERVELAALRADGVVCWARLQLEGESFSYSASRCSSESDYLAVALVQEGYLAAVRRDRIVWTRCGANDMRSQSETTLDASNVIACFPCYVTNELILVCRNGMVGRLASQN
jgi:tetratricopeptide (TPR) repeat protein